MNERIDYFQDLLEKSSKIHAIKNEDYTSGNNPHENFERCSLIASWFENAMDKVYGVFVAVKLARLATLLNKEMRGGKPNNESIDDSFLDLLTYVGLWYSNYKDRTSNLIRAVTTPANNDKLAGIGEIKGNTLCIQCGIRPKIGGGFCSDRCEAAYYHAFSKKGH